MANNCKICGAKNIKIFSAKILKKYDVDYYHCQNCNFIQTQDPYWLEEAYSSAISATDTGIMKRNEILKEKVSVIIFYLFNKDKKFLDYAGGYGIFVRMMRDLGFNFFWEDKYCQNLLAKGFESSNNANDKYEVITSFESFEHLANPIEEIKNILNRTDNILFTTNLIPRDSLPELDWWYYAQDTGQHISFYSEQTFAVIAKKFGLKFYTNGFLHLMCKEKPSLNVVDLAVLIGLARYRILNFLNKIIGKKRKFSNNGLFYEILKIRGLYKKIPKSLKSKTDSDSLYIQNNF